MITNKKITYYHKTFNEQTRLEEWQRTVFEKVWLFGGKGSSINKGYENANDVDVRIPAKYVPSIMQFAIGDIIAVGEQGQIRKQTDLEGVEFYNVTSVNINSFGNNPHVHLGGK